MDKRDDAGHREEDSMGPSNVAGDGLLHGPNLGRLCVMVDGTRVRVTGRVWDFFDESDQVEVTIEKANGRSEREEISVTQFDALQASAKLVL